MSLRVRLVAAMGTVLVVAVAGAVVVVRAQQGFLVDQIDDQLAAAMPFTGPAGDPGLPLPPSGEVPASESPISTLFIGIAVDDELTPLIQGQLLDDRPRSPDNGIELDSWGDAGATVEGEATGIRFRVRARQLADTDQYLVVALPLDGVESAIARLIGMFLAVGAVITVAFGLGLWWVERLGLQPISRVTSAAEAVSAGDRSQRVHGIDGRTEAGKLAHAFNLMLDDRDRVEQDQRRFVADASHELRTPLTSIRGHLDLYSQGRFSTEEQVRDMVRRMSREVARMKDLVEDLLLLANLDQQRPMRRDRVDVNRLVNDAAIDAGAVQSQRPVVVETTDDPNEITGDLFRLQQVIGALVDNALTHTDDHVEIRLATSRSAGTVEITVADDGPGLDPDTAARVFERFFRADPSRSRRTGNSGLGLAISRSIVEAHGASIDLQTEPGRGCVFTIRFPAGG